MASQNGRDEFTLVIPGIGLREPARHIIHKIVAARAEPFFIVQHKF
jgi:hypothetical protein